MNVTGKVNNSKLKNTVHVCAWFQNTHHKIRNTLGFEFSSTYENQLRELRGITHANPMPCDLL